MEQDEDDYVSYGTPLPELEEESVQRKKAAKELEVRDEKGRQRFHGAFTGGFSAGYFNTVGTKEGWAPASFVSSRNKTAERFQQNPEDFMDEEDLGEFGISTRRIQTTSKFADSSDLKTNKRKFSDVDSIIPGEAPLKDLVKPVRESIGIEILKKLGWKLGQGIGPRVKKDSGAAKMYGCSPFPDNSRIEEDDPVALSYTFAPKDVEAENYAPKDDVFGLGYTGLSKQSILGSQIDSFNPNVTKSWLKKDKKKLTISGQAFGVGAFEDDDEDIYSKDDMSQYDFSDLAANTASYKSTKAECKQLGASVVLEGFCLATEPPPIKKYYPPPNLPPHFKPIRSSIPKVYVSAEPQFKSRHALSSEDRSLLLGEKKFQSFQISNDKKDTEKKTDSSDKLKTSVIPKTKHTFRPFPNDQLKQQRYEAYLKLKETQEVEKLIQPPSMTEWEKQQEIEEFSRAAVLFKPLSAALSSKFESKSHLSVEHEVMDAIAKAKKENENVKTVDKRKLVGLSKRTTLEWHPASLLCKRFNVPNPYPNSSEEVSGTQKSKSLFDHISFETRENLPNPSESAHLETKPSSSPDAEQYMPAERTSNANELLTDVVLSSVNKSIQDSSFETKKPPIDFFKDIFENSSSDEESPQAGPSTQPSSSPKATETVTDSKLSTGSNNSKDPLPPKESKRAGFGVFANLDLDALNQRTSIVKSSDHRDCLITKEVEATEKINNENKTISRLSAPFSDPLKEKTTVAKTSGNNNSEIVNEVRSSKRLENETEVLMSSPSSSLKAYDLYGPELPPDYSVPTDSSSTKSIHKKHQKHKMKHKHKQHKHKSKKKKKKQSSHKSSDESSFASDEDIPPTVILEKLKKLQKVLKSNH